MPLTCHFEELDQPTRDYLHDVRVRKGNGTPGVYIPGKNPWPLVALCFGPLVGLILFFAPVGSGKPAWAIACLQTAGLLVGGWSVLYAVRRWLPGRSTSYGGFFHYFDPLHVYVVAGENVTVHSLKTVRGVRAFGNWANGGGVDFDLGDDRRFAVRLKPASAGRAVEGYYAAMAELEGDQNAQWATADPAVLGAAAKYMVDEEAPPRDAAQLGLEVDSLPADPGRDRRAGWGLLPLAVLFAAGFGVFLLGLMVNAPVNDEFAFDRAKATGAPGLRGYLLDDRNTRHREEAKQLLAKCYDRPILQLQNLPAGKKPEARAGVVKLLESLRTAETAVVSIQVKQKTGATASTSDSATRLRSELADGLARSIGPELIAFAAPPENKPAHLSLTYEMPDGEFGPPGTEVNVTMEVRTDIEQPPVSTAAWTIALPLNPGNVTQQTADLLRIELSRELVGEWKPAPVMNTNGDW
jgi:hypothetical protein